MVCELFLNKGVLKGENYDEALPTPLSMCRALLGLSLQGHYLIRAMEGQLNSMC